MSDTLVVPPVGFATRKATSEKRLRRAAAQIQMEVAKILVSKAKDPRIAWVTLLSVEVSPDLTRAKLFVRLPDEEEKALAVLKQATGFIRSELAKRLPWRRVPDLSFFIDRTSEEILHLFTLLDRVQNDIASDERPKA